MPKMPKRKKRPTFSTALICEALKKSNGRIFTAAKKIGCDSKTIYRRLKASRQVRDVLRECKGQFLDDTEDALHREIRAGNIAAICFYLKTQGKKRGYVEHAKTELSGSVGVVHSGQLEVGVRIVQRDDFYRNSAHGGDAATIETSASPAALTGEIQDCGVRPPLGQDGLGDDGSHRGTRERKQ